MTKPGLPDAGPPKYLLEVGVDGTRCPTRTIRLRSLETARRRLRRLRQKPGLRVLWVKIWLLRSDGEKGAEPLYEYRKRKT